MASHHKFQLPDQFTKYGNRRNQFDFQPNATIDSETDDDSSLTAPMAPSPAPSGPPTPPPSAPLSPVPSGPPQNTPLTQLSIGQLLINMKNTIFGIPEDIFSQGFSKQVFTKDNRLFYLGIFLILIFILYLILWNLTRFPCTAKTTSFLPSDCPQGICPTRTCRPCRYSN